jgi:antitoxin CptB
LLEISDHDIYGWVTGEREIPPEHRAGILAKIRQFHTADSR